MVGAAAGKQDHDPLRCVHAAQPADLPALSRNQVGPVEEGVGVDARMRPCRYVLDEVGKLLSPAAAAGILEVNEAYLASVPQPVGEVVSPWANTGCRAARSDFSAQSLSSQASARW